MPRAESKKFLHVIYQQALLPVICQDGERTIAGYSASNGLVYYPTIKVAAGAPVRFSETYTVGHQQTGLCVCDAARGFHSERDCRAYIEIIGSLLNWHRITSDNYRELDPQLVRIIRLLALGIRYQSVLDNGFDEDISWLL